MGAVTRLFAASAMQVLFLAVPVLTTLAALVVIGAAHRRDTGQAIGTLSHETIRADRSRPRPSRPAPASGREVERAAELHQRAPSGLLVDLAPPPAAPVRWAPPDPETMGVTRRQFFRHSILATVGLAVSGFGSATLAFLWPTASGGFGSKINLGDLTPQPGRRERLGSANADPGEADLDEPDLLAGVAEALAPSDVALDGDHRSRVEVPVDIGRRVAEVGPALHRLENTVTVRHASGMSDEAERVTGAGQPTPGGEL